MTQPTVRGRKDARWLQAWASYAAWMLGPLGLAGIAMAAAAVVLTLTTQWLWKPAALQLQREAVLLQRLQSAQATVPVAARGERAWLAQLPRQAQVPDMLAALQQHALRSGVHIERAEYRPPSTEGELRRMQVALPLQGDYRGIKRWLGRVLEAYPACAIDELSFQRRSGTAADPRGELQARVVLSFYLRDVP